MPPRGRSTASFRVAPPPACTQTGTHTPTLTLSHARSHMYSRRCGCTYTHGHSHPAHTCTHLPPPGVPKPPVSPVSPQSQNGQRGGEPTQQVLTGQRNVSDNPEVIVAEHSLWVRHCLGLTEPSSTSTGWLSLGSPFYTCGQQGSGRCMACPASCSSGRTEPAQVLILLTAEPTSSLLCSRPGPEGHYDSYRDWPHIGRSVCLSL